MDLHYTFTTDAAPVQAEGTVNGRRFYFRSRHKEWTFAVAEHPDINPVTLETPGSNHRGWVRVGRVEGPFQASYLGRVDADAIIRECASAYIAERAAS
jgi:hypothetical protein